ncbi:aldehyde ferredoxin oxidoreductase family protein [Chloroflexota bacterium]
MTSNEMYGYAGSILRVDLSGGSIGEEKLDEATLRLYLGGTGLGAKYLYENVPPKVEWSDPQNVLVLASGPLSGTNAPGSGTFSVVTTGAITNGATSSQANGYLGAYMKLSGFDAIVIQGASDKWVYLYLHDGVAELRNAKPLLGKDTWETEDAIKQELGLSERGASVFGIGPAGENLVRFATIVGDRGHVAAHNGPGAVMGSKKLKAVIAARGKNPVPVKDKKAVSDTAKEIIRIAKMREPSGYTWGTSMLYGSMTRLGCLPVKNLTTNTFPDYQAFLGKNYRPRLEMKWTPCWSCQAHHCHLVKVLDGPYAGYEGEEPEYECLAAWGSVIYQNDVGAAIMLSNETDKLGMDCNEGGWLIAMVMECYEKGLIDKEYLDGIELNWGDVEATRSLLHKIARRDGVGNTLAEGVMRAAQSIGGDAVNMGVYTRKGSVPRGHDHRVRWPELFDTVTSSVGTLESGGVVIKNPRSPQEVSTAIAKAKAARFFKDSLGICLIANVGTRTMTESDDSNLKLMIDLLNGATGWDYSIDDVQRMGLTAANLLRVFNIRQGMTRDLDYPSPRYGSAPAEGSAKGISAIDNWDEMLTNYYRLMGWDEKTGVPLPETLQKLGIGHLAADI